MAIDLDTLLNENSRLRKNLRFEAQSEFEKTIKDWIKERNDIAVKVLKERDNYSTGALANSIMPLPFEHEEGSLVVKIIANDYWDFINSGVNGVFQQHNSKYSFKNLGVGEKMKNAFSNFIRNKGITSLKYTDKAGNNIVKQLSNAKDYESAAYVLARATKKNGIKANHFMDIAYSDEAIKELSTKLEKEVVKIFK